ncbi:flagellar operon protein [Thermosyntropha lipolytica DSM 11003]|uniref:Flagellar operon protein n=1 Tax=Thermosyntropha lipolytica DSM 11003 TaxID=1123382 RepID=A0A1M5KZB0_9FIRM|nr:TIGR02530 family flagellar biosynthesis protein [Thermosyntropha lipolytica]SHG58164.1 flagellar operon protein [Thermosyntropha lipolytica DSM 11003]
MENRIIFFPNQVLTPLTPKKNDAVSTRAEAKGGSFNQILEKKLQGELKFSSHAQQRLKSRNIELSPEDLHKLEEAVARARSKGAKDSLILMNDLALVVSIKNNTVITAVNGENLKENVFTNIDSAVII